MYRYQATVRLHHTDAAGVVFFSNLFVIAHDAYESFLASHLPLNRIISDAEYLIPIVHAEADYLLPLTLSEEISVELCAEKTGNSSFELGYVVRNSRMKTAARLKTIHTVQSKENRRAMAIPDALKSALAAL